MRLADGTLATITEPELQAHRPTYASHHARREPVAFLVERSGRHATVTLEPRPSAPTDARDAAFADIAFEAKIGAYLKATEEWAPPDRPAPAERHFIRKKRRARDFEARPEGV